MILSTEEKKALKAAQTYKVIARTDDARTTSVDDLINSFDMAKLPPCTRSEIKENVDTINELAKDGSKNAIMFRGAIAFNLACDLIKILEN